MDDEGDQHSTQSVAGINMFDTFFQLIQKFSDSFQAHPIMAAGIVGVALSMLATQGLKMYIPDGWTDRQYRLTTQIIGFVTGWFFTYGAWIIFDPKSSNFVKFYASASAGFAGPAIYSFVSSYIMHKFTWFDERFSGRPKSVSEQSKPVPPAN